MRNDDCLAQESYNSSYDQRIIGESADFIIIHYRKYEISLQKECVELVFYFD